MIKQISLCLMILIMIVNVTNGHDEVNQKKPIVMEKFESFKSVSSDGAKFYWEKVQMGIKTAHGYIFKPPTLDFKGSQDTSEGGEKGAGEKMQDAVTKTLEKTKSSVEDSASSAAHTVHQTAQKIKDTVSPKSTDQHSTSEL